MTPRGRIALAVVILIVAAMLGWWLAPGRSAPVVPINQGPAVEQTDNGGGIYVDPTYYCVEGGDGLPGYACYLADDLPETAAPVVPLSQVGSLSAEAAPAPAPAPAPDVNRAPLPELPGEPATVRPSEPVEDTAYCYEYDGMDDGWQCQAAPDSRPLAWSGPWSLADAEWHAQHPAK